MLAQWHQWTGYVVVLVVVGSVLWAYKRAKDGVEYEEGVFRVVGLLLALQVLLGLVLYGVGEYWDAEALQAYVHPVLMILAVGAAGAATARARREAMAADAYRTIGRLHGAALVLVVLGVGAASAA